MPPLLKHLSTLQVLIERLYASRFERGLADGWIAAWPLDDL